MNLKETVDKRFNQRTASTLVEIHGKRIHITWQAHLMAHTIYKEIYPGQDAGRIHERGGFGETELDVFYPEWRNHIVEKW